MRSAARIATAIGLFGRVLGIGGAANATTVNSALASQLTRISAPPGIYGADAEFAPVIEAAIDRYDAIGLELPRLRIYVHSTSAGCQGHEGTYGQYGQRDRIDLCTESRFYVLHELAHAWEQHTLTDEVREAVMEHADKEVWHDRDLPWLDSAAEVAANNIAWGLMGPPLSEFEVNAFAPLLERFELLTGVTSPRID